jgi:MSHA biogenesis protein MshK
MAEYLTHRWPPRLLSVVLLAMLPAAASMAQGMADPTRPPAGIAGEGALARGNGGTVIAGQPAGHVLQAIRLSGGRSEAMIGGQLVHQGDRVGTGEVIRISESEVVLRTTEGLQTLKLFPGIEKRYMDARYASMSSERKKEKTK